MSGGTLPYTYNWSNGGQLQNINNLMSGPYDLTITDANNCQLFASFDITVNTIRIDDKFDVELYPNPIRRGQLLSLSTETLSKNTKFQITNVLGQKVEEGILRKGKAEHKIQVPEQQGVYLITFYEDKTPIGTFKVIVQ